MFDQLFKQPCALARQQTAPFASERASYLEQRAEAGAAAGTLVRLARELLVVVRELDLTNNDVITPSAIETAADRWAIRQQCRHRTQTPHWSQTLFRQTATDWLRFLGRLSLPQPEPQPFASLVEQFTNHLQYERGLSTATIANYQWHIERFLAWFSPRQQTFSQVAVPDIDAFLANQAPHRGPHALRHACACHLLAEGFSLDAIREHLGHQSLDSTRHSAKVDLTGLREVARFDLGGLL